MQASIVTTMIGVFGVADSQIVLHKPFPKDPEKIAEKLKSSETKFIEEENFIKAELTNKGYAEIEKADLRSQQFIKENLAKLALDYRFVKSIAEFKDRKSVV